MSFSSGALLLSSETQWCNLRSYESIDAEKYVWEHFKLLPHRKIPDVKTQGHDEAVLNCVDSETHPSSPRLCGLGAKTKILMVD